MTKRPFNWDYDTAHPYGHSHVRDARPFATFTGIEDITPKPSKKSIHTMTDAEWQEAMNG